MRLTQILLKEAKFYKPKPGEFKYWQRYVERQMRKTMGVQTYNRLTGYKTVGARKFFFTENRPWTSRALMENALDRIRPKVMVEPMKRQEFFKGDVVEVLVGKDKGKKGIINKVVLERNWCFVEGLHLKFETIEKSATHPGFIVRIEKPLLMTGEVALVDPSDNKATEIEWRYLEDGTEVRVSKRTGRIIMKSPDSENSWEDFVNVSKYIASKTKDTEPAELKKVTFKPKLCTFEEDILEKHGIKENRTYQKKYWY